MSDAALDLIERWEGPHGGLPPFDRATPELIERATMIAIERKRAEIAAIAANPEPPTFANVCEALEDSGRALQRTETLRNTFASTRATGDMAEVNRRLAPLVEALDDEIAHNNALFARVDAVHAQSGSLTAEQARLVTVIREAMVRRGAGLPEADRARLKEVNIAIASAQARFNQNLIDEAQAQAVFVEDAAALAGLPESLCASAARLAEERSRPGAWAIANTRPMVWPVLQLAADRDLRRRVRTMWMARGANDGPHDNRPVIAEIMKLRGEKARLHGYPTFAHWAAAGRMAGTPDKALDQLMRTWRPVRDETLRRIALLQELAAEDGLTDPIEPWDFLYYLEKYRALHFGFDGNAMRPYLTIDNVLNAIFEAAGRLHGLSFTRLPDAPVVHPDVQVWEVRQGEEPIAVVWFDLLVREGKSRGSWQMELQAAERFRGRRLCFSNICSNLEREGGDGPVLMSFEYANVLFHEFGHALHMMMSRAAYPSLGSMQVAWDMIEVPSQLNERWLRDRDLLRRHARHFQTGEPMPDDLIDAMEAVAQFDRVTSATVEYLAPAIVDMRMNLLADGRDVDPVAVEQAIYAEIGMPAAVDPIMRVPHQFHSFSNAYAAGLYVYLWADVMVAEVLQAFADAPGGIYDAAMAAKWRDALLGVGNAVPGQQAFRDFRGRDPDPDAFLKRFALA
jgi:peptidyl-dipeptidase Dcp